MIVNFTFHSTVLLGRIFHKTAHYSGSAIACPTAGNVNYFPQQHVVHSDVIFNDDQIRILNMLKKILSFISCDHTCMEFNSNELFFCEI